MTRKEMGAYFCPINDDPRTKQQIKNVQSKKRNEYDPNYYKSYEVQENDPKKFNSRTVSCGDAAYKKNQNNEGIPLSQPKIKDDYNVSSSAFGYDIKNNLNVINRPYHTVIYKSNLSSSYNKDYTLCGIKNIGNNCYLNSGLQILARCSSFIKKLSPFNSEKFPFTSLLYKTFDSLLNNQKEYDPSPFIEYFCKKNKEFILGEQSCSQNFIRTVLNNVNDEIKFSKMNCFDSEENYNPKDQNEIKAYNNYIKENHIYPESDALSTFTGILKSHTKGECGKCHKKFNKNTFCYFIDLNMYLQNIYERCDFNKVIKENLPQANIFEMECFKCKNIMKMTEENKLVKLPEILIFTLERFLGGANKVEIHPDDYLELQDYLDPNLTGIVTTYELFAINIRIGSTKNFGHEICQIKINETWYEFNDSYTSLKKKDYDNCSYGLYYKRLST